MDEIRSIEKIRELGLEKYGATHVHDTKEECEIEIHCPCYKQDRACCHCGKVDDGYGAINDE